MSELRLRRDGDQLWQDREGEAPRKVRAVWARPLTGRGQELAILDDDGNEVALFERPDELPDTCRDAVLAALDERYFLPEVLAVTGSDVRFGRRALDVETDAGPRRLAIKDPQTSVMRLPPDQLLITDVVGARYRIPSLAALDATSRYWLERVL